jgi:hypothetical protein
MKSLKKIISLALVAAFLITSTEADAQWQRRTEDLPGTTSGNELITYGVIVGSALLVALLIPMPDAELKVKRSDLVNRNGKPAENRDEAVGQFASFSGPCVVDRKTGGKDLYGVVRRSGDDAFSVETLDGDVEVPYADVKSVVDLQSAGDRSKMRNVKLGIVMAGVSVASLYSASTADGELEESSATLSRVMALGSGALAVLMFVHQPGTAKQYKTWEQAHQSDSPPEGENEQVEGTSATDSDKRAPARFVSSVRDNTFPRVALGMHYGKAPVIGTGQFGSRTNSVWVTFGYSF